MVNNILCIVMIYLLRSFKQTADFRVYGQIYSVKGHFGTAGA